MAPVLSLRPDPDEVRRARLFCIGALGEVVDTERHEAIVDDVTMIASELVTNAIRAGAGAIRLQVETLPATAGVTRFRIAVADDAGGEVVPRTPGPLATNGRGLQIVAALADAWGVVPGARGKQVWAELDLPAIGRPAGGELTDAAVG